MYGWVTMDTAYYTLSLALFDSFSTAQQIIIFILLLTTLKPLRNSLAYLAGLSGAYLACGYGGFLALDRLQVWLRRFTLSTASLPDSLYYRSELISGLIMTLIGAVYYRRHRNAPPPRSQNLLLTRLKSMNAWAAGGLGAFISLTSFPFALPYILALEKYASLGLSATAALSYILLYNLAYALPMLAVLMVYFYASNRRDDIHDALHDKTRMLNVHLTSWAWAGIGLLSIIDALCFFALGHALIKGRLL